jgi:hypothetical protein
VIAAAAIAWRYAVDAERKPLEEIAPPLNSMESVQVLDRPPR